jgi:hypothetical protein
MQLRALPSRRAILLSLWRAFVFCRLAPREAWAHETGVRRLLGSHPATSVQRYHRRFRAKATILVLGVPIFKRADVGAGCASVEVGVSGDRTVTALQFAAGSKPERARGLNRLGLMREAVIEQGARLLKTSYTGFISSSPEKSLDQGRRTLDTATGEMPCTLGTGESGTGRTDLAVRRFTLPAATRWTEASDILDGVCNHAADGEGSGTLHETSVCGPSATFLYSVHRAALEKESSARRQFYHNGKLHELVTQKQLLSPSSVRMTGAIRDPSRETICEFTVWFDPADPSGIPNRIEFRARSFLRLLFESESDVRDARAALPCLIDEERLPEGQRPA